MPARKIREDQTAGLIRTDHDTSTDGAVNLQGNYVISGSLLIKQIAAAVALELSGSLNRFATGDDGTFDCGDLVE